jgi:hypothetical protein
MEEAAVGGGSGGGGSDEAQPTIESARVTVKRSRMAVIWRGRQGNVKGAW